MVTVPLDVALRRTGDDRIIVMGTVVSVDTSAARAVVDIDGLGTRLDVPYMRPDPSPGDVAVLIRSANRLWMLGTHGETVPIPPEPDPEDEPPEDVPPPPPTTTTVTLTPTATGTARGGSVRPDTSQLYQGDWTGRGRNSGMAVYKARQLSGTVISCRLRIQRLSSGVFAPQAPTLRLMAQSSLVGSPTWQQSQVGPALTAGQSATVNLPDSWGQALVNGTAGGIGIHVDSSSPYVRLAGKAEGSMTVTLRLRS